MIVGLIELREDGSHDLNEVIGCKCLSLEVHISEQLLRGLCHKLIWLHVNGFIRVSLQRLLELIHSLQALHSRIHIASVA